MLCGCDSGVEWRDGEYEVSWLDTADNRSLYRSLDEGGGIGRVGAEVIAVGSDDRYIVAKQRSQGDGAVSYFIVDRKKDHAFLNADEITEGPFSAKDSTFLKVREVFLTSRQPSETRLYSHPLLVLPNKRLQPTLGNPRAAEAIRYVS